MPATPVTSWEAGRIDDERGRRVSQLDPVLMHLQHKHGVIPPQALREMVDRIGFGMTHANRFLFWAALLGVVCIVIAASILGVRLAHGTISLSRFVTTLIPFSSLWVTIMAFWMGARGVRFQKVRAVMLACGYCPHCGYELHGLAPDPSDGATVCPECGCAWKLGRAGEAGN